MSSLKAAPSPAAAAPAASRPPVRRTRRLLKVLLVAAGVLAGAAVLLSVAANAAVSTFAAHDHGTIDITIDGETVDLDQPRFHDLHPQFHVHAGHGNRWHHHPGDLTGIFGFESMTLRQALTAIGAQVTDGGFAFDGAVYGSADATVTVTVGGAPVEADSHVIADGDDISIEVVTGR